MNNLFYSLGKNGFLKMNEESLFGIVDLKGNVIFECIYTDCNRVSKDLVHLIKSTPFGEELINVNVNYLNEEASYHILLINQKYSILNKNKQIGIFTDAPNILFNRFLISGYIEEGIKTFDIIDLNNPDQILKTVKNGTIRIYNEDNIQFLDEIILELRCIDENNNFQVEYYNPYYDKVVSVNKLNRKRRR